MTIEVKICDRVSQPLPMRVDDVSTSVSGWRRSARNGMIGKSLATSLPVCVRVRRTAAAHVMPALSPADVR